MTVAVQAKIGDVVIAGRFETQRRRALDELILVEMAALIALAVAVVNDGHLADEALGGEVLPVKVGREHIVFAQ